TGEGQIVDSALYEAVLQVMESLVPDYSVSDYVRRRSGSILPGIAPSNAYACKDGDYLIGANQDTVFARMCEAMGQPELASDPRFVDHVARGQNQGMLDAMIDDWTRGQTMDEVEVLMIRHGIPAGRVYTPAEMLDDPHFAARETIVDVPHPRWAGLKMQNVFPRLSRSPGAIRSIAPQVVGENNVEIYSGLLGLGDDELKRLAGQAVI
ncbi:MAG: CoA transferase, partial [Sphingomicrobium sp.]